MTVTHTAYRVAARIEGRGPALDKAMADALDVQAQKIAAKMRLEAPKFLSLLANSVHVAKPNATERLIAPGTAYAEAVHAGMKPGKGLPRYSDPRAGNIVAWLKSKAFAGTRAPRKNSRGAVLQNLELRDRYEGLSRHVYRYGTKANPFVERTYEAVAGTVVAALKAAATNALNGDGGGGGGGTATA